MINKKIFFALHLYRMPDCKEFVKSLNNAAVVLRSHGYTPYKGCVFFDPYIQKARNRLVQEFLASDCDTLFFVADDLEFSTDDLMRVIETPGRFVVGVYPLKTSPIRWVVGYNTHPKDNTPVVREDGCISATRVQTGFMRIHREVFENIIGGYPELSFYGRKNGKPINVKQDFFPQGVHNHVWIGEDFAFCDLWTKLGGKIWIVPDLTLTHHDPGKGYKGNFHEYLMGLPGGCKEGK